MRVNFRLYGNSPAEIILSEDKIEFVDRLRSDKQISDSLFPNPPESK